MNVFEKFHADNPIFDGVLLVRGPSNDGSSLSDVLLFLSDGRGHDILAITADGQMHFAPGYTPTQQAEAFRQAMNMLNQRAVFPLAPPPAPDEVSTTQSPDATYYVDTPSPAAELHDIVELHFSQQRSKLTDPEPCTPKAFPIREDVPHPDKLL